MLPQPKAMRCVMSMPVPDSRVEIRKIGGGDRNRKGGKARQYSEPDFGLQLMAPTIAKRVGEVAGEFDEKLGV